MDSPQHRAPIPRRRHPLEDKERGLIIDSAVMHKMKVCNYIVLILELDAEGHDIGCIILSLAE